jgi:hypothetical protein
MPLAPDPKRLKTDGEYQAAEVKSLENEFVHHVKFNPIWLMTIARFSPYERVGAILGEIIPELEGFDLFVCAMPSPSLRESVTHESYCCQTCIMRRLHPT